MLPVIQEQLLLIKALQGICQTLLSLALGYLLGEALLSLFGKTRVSPGRAGVLPGDPTRQPPILTGRRVGLLIALLMACNLVLMKIAYGPTLFSGPFWRALTLPFVIGLALILAARQHLRKTYSGRLALVATLFGDLFLLTICFFLLNAESLLLTPETWPLLSSRPLLLVSWHGTLRFVQFALLAVMLAALHQQHKRKELILCSALLWIPLQLAEWQLLPELARSSPVCLATGLALGVSIVLALTVIRALLQKKSLPLLSSLISIILLTMLWVLSAQIAREKRPPGETPIRTGSALTGNASQTRTDPDEQWRLWTSSPGLLAKKSPCVPNYSLQLAAEWSISSGPSAISSAG